MSNIYKDLMTNVQNHTLIKKLLQGSTQHTFNFVPFDQGNRLKLDPAAEVSVIALYDPKLDDYGRLQYAGSYLLEPTDPSYDITISTETADGADYSVVKVPFREQYVTFAGTCELILKITGPNAKDTYTYGMYYTVDRNDAYFKQSIPNNLPTYADIRKLLDDVKLQSDTNKANITTNTQAIVDKAQKDLSNVDGYSGIPTGGLLAKDAAGVKHSGIVVTGDNIDASTKSLIVKDVQTQPGTVYVGYDNSISSIGNNLQMHNNATDSWALLVKAPNDENTGTSRATIPAAGVKESRVVIQPDASQNMNNVQRWISGHPTFNRQVQAMYLKLTSPVTNFCYNLEVNGKIIGYYPSKNAWDGKVPGYNLGANEQDIPVQPFFDNDTSYSIVLNMKADQPINLLGNGTVPWYALDLNRTVNKEIPFMEDLTPNNYATGASFSGNDLTITRSNNLPDISASMPLATGSANGAMGSTDKSKLDGIEAGAEANPSNDEIVAAVSASLGNDDWKLPGGADTFAQLTDTPVAYVGQANKLVAVNSAEDALVFVDGSSSGDLSGLAKKDLSNVDPSTLKTVGTSAGLADEDVVSKNTQELDRINALRNQDVFTANITGNLTGKVDNTKAYKGYFLSGYNIDDKNNVLILPNHPDIQTGTPFFVDNQDINSSIRVTASQGQVIDQATNSKNVPSENVLFLIKESGGWKTAAEGVLPASISRIIGDVKLAYPNIGQAGLTIQEIENALSDKLKTTSQIAKTFADKLHTFDQIDAEMIRRGYEKAMSSVGMQGDSTKPVDTSWRIKDFRPNEETLIPVQNNGQQYIVFTMPNFLAPLISEVDINNSKLSFNDYDFVDNELDYKIFISSVPVDTTLPIRLKISYDINVSTDGSIGVQGDEPDDLYIDITDLEFPKALVKTDGFDSKKAIVSPYINVKFPLDQTVGEDPQPDSEFKSDAIKFLPPLRGFSDPDEQLGVVVDIDHLAYEHQHNSGFLAYRRMSEVLLGLDNDPKKWEKGKLWFDDTIIEADGVGIKSDRVNKAWGIQEYDGKDPNVTGGTDFLVTLRVSLKGTAPNGGFIRLMLVKKGTQALSDSTIVYLKDKAGRILADEKLYEKGDELGEIQVCGVVNATGLEEFHCVILTSIDGDIYLNDKQNGISGLVIQSLTSTEKTGLALTQFELDTQQDINFTGIHLGDDLANLHYEITDNTGPLSVLSGKSVDDLRGWGATAVSQINWATVKGQYIEVEGDGIVHHISSADETLALRGKQIKVTTTLTNKQTGYILALLKWTGKPDEYTSKLFTSRNQLVPVFDAGWEKVDQKIINVDIIQDMHTVVQNFTIPIDANNYAVCIYPETDLGSAELRLAQIKLDVVNPFNTYYIHSTRPINQFKLYMDKEIKHLEQNTQGNASLRYTINNTHMPMPVGILGEGNADIALDPTINVINGSQAKGGEGAIKFNRAGIATIQTNLRVWSEQDNNYNVQFWYSKVSDDGQTFTKISESDVVKLVKKHASNVLLPMPEFTIEVKPGDRIALFSQSDIVDGAFIECTSDHMPMVDTLIHFDEITAQEQELIDKVNSAKEFVFIKDGQPVPAGEYIMKVDVDTGKTSIEEV